MDLIYKLLKQFTQAFMVYYILIKHCHVSILNQNNYRQISRFFSYTPSADVRWGFRLSVFYVKMVLSWSKFLVGWEFHTLCVFYIVYSEVFGNSYQMCVCLVRCISKFVPFHHRSTYVHVCLTNFSRMFHYGAHIMLKWHNWHTNHEWILYK